MAKKVTKINPAYEGIAGRQFEYEVPEEGEIFRNTAGPNYGVYIMQGGKARLITPSSQTAYPGQKFNPADERIHPFIEKELGISLKDLPEYNTADFYSTLGEKWQGENILATEAKGIGKVGAPTTLGALAKETITTPGAKTYKEVPGYGKAPVTQTLGVATAPTNGIVIPTGEAAVGKQVTIGGQLYPSQEWYDVHVLGKKEATSTTPVVTPTPTPTPGTTTVKRPSWVKPGEQWSAGETETEHQARIAEEARNNAADEANKNAQTIFDNLPAGGDIDIRDSTKIIEDIQEKLEESEEKIPEPVSMVDLFKEQKEKLGIDVLETELADLDADIERINTELLVQAEEAGEKLISTREIGRAKGALQKRADREIALLNVERSAVARQLSNKYDSLEMVMNITQQDFTNASTYYTNQYNRTISLFNLALGLEEKEYTRAEKAEQDARANWDVVTNAMKDNGIAFGDLTDDQKLKLDQLETQAGLPTGFSEKILASVNPDKTVVSKITSTDKSQISILYDDGTVEVFDTGLIPEPEEEDEKELNWSQGTKFVDDNPDASYEDLLTGLKRYTDLNDSDIKSLLTSKGKKPIKEIEKEEEEAEEKKEFLTRDWFIEKYGKESLIKKAKEEGYASVWHGGEWEMNQYLDATMKGIEARREAGMTDQEILKAMK